MPGRPQLGDGHRLLEREQADGRKPLRDEARVSRRPSSPPRSPRRRGCAARAPRGMRRGRACRSRTRRRPKAPARSSPSNHVEVPRRLGERPDEVECEHDREREQRPRRPAGGVTPARGTRAASSETARAGLASTPTRLRALPNWAPRWRPYNRPWASRCRTNARNPAERPIATTTSGVCQGITPSSARRRSTTFSQNPSR